MIFLHLHIFPYSKREGTEAAEMEDQVPSDVASERFKRLIALQDSIAEKKNSRFIGRRIRVLADEISKTDSTMLTAANSHTCRFRTSERKYKMVFASKE